MLPSLKCCPIRRLLPVNLKSEAWAIFKLAWPLIVSDLAELVFPVITLQFVGQYGETYLAAAGLGMSFCNVSGVAFVIGFDTATATLCSQSYGAKNFKRYGVVVQRALIIQLVLAFSMAALWINADQILVHLHQDAEVSRLADQFIIWRIPSLLLLAVFKTMKSYLMCQHIVLPFAVFAILGITCNVVCNIIFVNVLQLGVVGSSMAINMSYVLLCTVTFAYIRVKKVYKTWPGWSWECLNEWPQFVSLALPGTLMIVFDWSTAETGVFILGLVDKKQLGAQSVIFNILSLMFMPPLGLSIAADIKVGNFLGAGEPQKAVNIAKTTLIMTCCESLFMASCLIGTKDYIGYAFTKSKDLITIIKDVLPLIAGYHFLDATQGVSAGILRGCGLQIVGAVVNFIGFDMIGLPLGIVLVLRLHMNIIGFWTGLLTGMFWQVVAMFIILSVVSWRKLSIKARSRAGVDSMELIENEFENEDTGLPGVESNSKSQAEPGIASYSPDDVDHGRGSQEDQDFDTDQIRFESHVNGNNKTRIKLHIIAIVCVPSALLVMAVLVRLYT